MKQTSNRYAEVECPTCLAMKGEQCRDPKTLKYMGTSKEDLHKSRVLVVQTQDDRRAKLLIEQQDYQKKILDQGDIRVKEFFRRYRLLCQEMGMALGHQDNHGAFILMDSEVEDNILWAEAAIERLEPLTPEKTVELQALYEKLGTREGAQSADYESFGDFLSNRD